MNIWVGSKGGGLPASLKNGIVEFRVEKAWINDNNVNESLVTLQWYNKSWESLYTEKVGEDNNYTYFTSKTPGFSSFAITEYTGEVDENVTKVGEIMLDILGDLESTGEADINRSANNSGAKEVAKNLMAICLPLFLIFVGYLIVKKKL